MPTRLLVACHATLPLQMQLAGRVGEGVCHWEQDACASVNCTALRCTALRGTCKGERCHTDGSMLSDGDANGNIMGANGRKNQRLIISIPVIGRCALQMPDGSHLEPWSGQGGS